MKNNKFKDLLELMFRLSNNEELTINKVLADEMGISIKTLSRYLDEIANKYSDVLIVEKKKVESHPRQPNVYRMVRQNKDLATILNAFFEKKTDLTWMLQLLHEKDPMLTNEKSSDDALKKLLNDESDIFIFKSTPFEILDEKHKKIFSNLKTAVKFNKYKNIHYRYDQDEVLENVKCLKLIFMQNNWYLAIEDVNVNFRLLRLSFIQSVEPSKKGTYRESKVTKYKKHYEKIQNAMTLHDAPRTKAIFLASPKVAIYFKEGMKPFLDSQKYIRTNEDGSVEFELYYTQTIEILPFIKTWLPDIKIISPSSLIDVLLEDVKRASYDYVS